MHISLKHAIGEGDLYYAAFPRWPGVYDWHLPAQEHWNETEVLAIRPPREEFREDFHLKRVKVPLGSTALVLSEPGVGPHAQQLGQWYPRLGADAFVECLVTVSDEESFVAVVGVTELWTENPLEEKHTKEWPMPENDLGPKGGYPQEEEIEEEEVEEEPEEVEVPHKGLTLSWAQEFLDDIEHGSPVTDWESCLPELVQDLVALLKDESKK